MGIATNNETVQTLTCPYCRQVKLRATARMARSEGWVSEVQVTGKPEAATLPDGRTVVAPSTKTVQTPLCCSMNCARSIALAMVRGPELSHVIANEDADRAVERAVSLKTPPAPGRVGEPSRDLVLLCGNQACGAGSGGRACLPVPRSRDTLEAVREYAKNAGWAVLGQAAFCSRVCRDTYMRDPGREQRLRTAEAQIAAERAAPAPAPGRSSYSVLDHLPRASSGRPHGGIRETHAEKVFKEHHGGKTPAEVEAARSTMPSPSSPVPEAPAPLPRPRSRRGT